jgi:small-conductance mechanosensitive channel
MQCLLMAPKQEYMNNALEQISELFNHSPKLLTALLVLGLTILYWFGYSRLSKYFNKKYSPKIAAFTNTWLLMLALLLTMITILTAFSTSFTLFVSSISFLSAALVFALQDFFANFMAWIYITTSDQYSVRDNILITSDTRVIYGTVKDVGIFRTTLFEKLGDNSLDTEMNTGRLLTFPNRFIHKHSLTNYTKNHLLLQHKFSFTVEYESNNKKAKEIITDTVDGIYLKLQADEELYLDPQFENDQLYTPKVYTHIDDSGVTYTVWYACKAGLKRIVLDMYSEAILERLSAEGIHLAYNTIKYVS